MGVGPAGVPELTAGPFRLRAFDEADLPLIEEASHDPFIPLITTVPSVYTGAEGVAFLRRQHDRVVSGEGYPFVIEDPGGRGIGACGVWLRNLDLGRVSFGYWVIASARGRGAAAHALTACADWALTTFEPTRLELYVEPWNEASIRTAERAGFVREGLLRRWELVGNEWKDMWMYSRLRSDDRG
jgi:RimJ/RimL family protein N-acetyltransferase